MIPFLQTSPFDLALMFEHLKVSQNEHQWSNHGPCEQKLERLLEGLTDAYCVCVANATVGIEVLHRIFGLMHEKVWCPSFTFPATNASIPSEKRRWVEPIYDGEFIAHTKRKPKTKDSEYQILTVPFGDQNLMPVASTEDCDCVVDAAACASPDMKVVRHWLKNEQAKAVVVSLHSTKLWPAGEGGFIACDSPLLAVTIKHMLNFGIKKCDQHGKYTALDYGTNGKMSELSAAAALANFSQFVSEYARRLDFSAGLKEICKEFGIDCIASPQSFWFRSPMNYRITQDWFFSHGIEARHYYWQGVNSPDHRLSANGVCLPVWPENKEIQQSIKYKLKEFLDGYCSGRGFWSC